MKAMPPMLQDALIVEDTLSILEASEEQEITPTIPA